MVNFDRAKRFVIMNKIFLSLIFIILLFAYVDAMQLSGVYQIISPDKWMIYQNHIQPAFQIVWWMVIVAMGLVYYLIVKDKSESIAIIIAGGIMMFTGLEDLFFTFFKPETMSGCLNWFQFLPWNLIQEIFKIPCVNTIVLLVTSIIGIVVAYYVMDYLRRKY